jgi:hypothetical protein
VTGVKARSKATQRVSEDGELEAADSSETRKSYHADIHIPIQYLLSTTLQNEEHATVRKCRST